MTGTFRQQTFGAGGEQRFYLLHVPASYRCDSKGWPVLVDFHGTGGGTADSAVEEYYGTEDLLSLADQERFLVVRPRSRWETWNGGRVYQWDINSGDLERNGVFARELTAHIKSRYHVDAQRVYASGFSSGTNMAGQFLGDVPALFHGYAVHAGGLWNQPLRGNFGSDAPRIYATTGYRDYMFSTQQTLRGFLKSHGHPASSLWVRESDTGHDLYGWHFRETFAWLDRGEKPSDGTLASGWTKETVPSGESLVQLARSSTGELTASASGGAFFHRSNSGVWALSGKVSKTASYAPVFTDLCFFPSGKGLAVGEGVVALTTDNGVTWSKGKTIPEFGEQQFGYAYLTTIECSGDRVTGGGYWAAVTSSNEGSTFGTASMLGQAGDASQLAAVRSSPSGKWVAAGYYNYVGSSGDGVNFTARSPNSQAEWFNDVAPGPNGKWWVVGERGTIIASSDDGTSWTELFSPTTEDLYAVDFYDGLLGMAVGAHGIALLTTDGGFTWQKVSTGLNGFLGDVNWLDSTTAIVVGEAGTALRFSRN